MGLNTACSTAGVKQGIVFNVLWKCASKELQIEVNSKLQVQYMPSNLVILQLVSLPLCSTFKAVQVNVVNLGDTSHSEYRINSQTGATTSQVYHEVINKFR